MASRKGDPGGSEKGKVKFMFFELEGNDATLQDAIKSINGVINRATGGNGIAAPKRVNALPIRSAAEGVNGAQQVTDDPDVIDTEALADDETITEEATSAVSRRKSGVPTKYPEPKLLDIDFTAPGVTLKDYMKSAAPKSHNDKFLAASAWFRLHGNVEEVTSDHVYSAYRAMNWTSRKNMSQPFYFLEKKGWASKNGSGWRLTHIGLDQANTLSGKTE